MRWGRTLRAVSIATVAVRLARGLRARDGVARSIGPSVPTTVVVPARDEASRIAPLLAALRGAPGVVSVIVVDDGSTDGTAEIAATAGALVVRGTEPPPGWTGKSWALDQGVGAAETEWVVALDADVVPDPDLPRSVVDRAIADGIDLLTVAGRSDLPAGMARWLHAAMLAQLVYRFGPPGTSRRLANGQCIAARRRVLRDALQATAGELVEDVAMVRFLASTGARVDFLDATDLMVVRPYRSTGEVWSGWGRSIGLRGVEPWWRQLAEVALLASTLVAPPVRIVRRSADLIDLVAVVMRVGTLVGMRRAELGRGAAYWCSPLADPVALAAMVSGLIDPSPTWRGRRVGHRSTRPRTGTRRTSSARP